MFTLPINKKGYAIEKYVFGLMISISTLFIATGIAYGVNVVKGQSITNEGILIAAIYLPILILVLSIMIPLQLKYGGEKGRIAMIVIFGIGFLGIYGLYQVIRMINFDYMAIITNIASLSTPVLILIISVIMLLILAISIQASIHVMKKKEF